MTQRVISKIRGLTFEVNKLQDNIVNAVGPLLTNPINYGIILESIQLDGSTPLTIDHLLGRQPLGWIVVDKSAAGSPYRTAWDTRTITLHANSAVTLSIYIF